MQKSELIRKIFFPREKKRHIYSTTINNSCNTQIVKIFHAECDGNFNFSVDMLSRLPNPVEISHEWLLTNFKHQEPEFYARLFDYSEEGTSEGPTDHSNFGTIGNPVPVAHKLYVL